MDLTSTVVKSTAWLADNPSSNPSHAPELRLLSMEVYMYCTSVHGWLEPVVIDKFD